MKTLIGIALATALLAMTAPAFAADPCKDGTAPAGWLRDGGYCSVANDTNQHSGFAKTNPPNVWSKIHNINEWEAYWKGTLVL